MKITLSKTFGGALSGSLNVARPGIRGLYGKNPKEKTKIAMGMRTLARNTRLFAGTAAFLVMARWKSSDCEH